MSDPAKPQRERQATNRNLAFAGWAVGLLGVIAVLATQGERAVQASLLTLAYPAAAVLLVQPFLCLSAAVLSGLLVARTPRLLWAILLLICLGGYLALALALGTGMA